MRRASQFELAAHAGAAYTTPWFSTPMGGGSVGPGETAGAHATFWFSPRVGARASASYAAGSVESPNSLFTSRNESFRTHMALYDAGVVLRPFFFSGAPPSITSTYLYLGAGGLTASRGTEVTCSAPSSGPGECLAKDVGSATVAQGVVALGIELLPLSDRLTLFAEAALHAYDSPAHVTTPSFTTASSRDRYDATAGPSNRYALHANDSPAHAATAGSSDRYAATGTLSLGAKLLFGEILPPPPVIPPPPPVAFPATDSLSRPTAPMPRSGGSVEVTTTAPGADVYLVLQPIGGLSNSAICALRPILAPGRPYLGRTTSGNPVRGRGNATSYVLVVRQYGRVYQRVVRPSNNSNTVVRLNMMQAGTPLSCGGA